LHQYVKQSKKANAIKDSKRHDTDTGSPEAQVALLTRQIDELATHLKKAQERFSLTSWTTTDGCGSP